MANEDTSKAKNAAERVRVVLFNYDLEIAAAQGLLKIANAKVIRLKDKKGPLAKESYFEAKLDQVKLETYIQQLTVSKNETWDSISSILDMYESKYKKIWIMFFINNLTIQEISEKANYSTRNVDKIVQRFKRDLIEYEATKDRKEG